MFLKRQSVFETNSSSTHSLTVDEYSFTTDTEYKINQEGYLEILPQTFGWERETYTDASSKLVYVYLYIRDWVRDLEDKLHFAFMLQDVCKEQTGCLGLQPMGDPTDRFYPMGYIDHQSVESRDCDWLFQDKETLRNFIFNKNSILETDNDN